MFILGIISFIQITFLPGFLFLKVTRINTLSKIQKLLYSFGLSFFINYLVIYTSVLVGIYNRWVFLSLILIEFSVILLLFFTKAIIVGFNYNIREIKKRYFESIKGKSNGYLILYISANLILLFYISIFISNLGTTFYVSDAINSWNKWAIDWSHNMLPHNTWHYPQLIPANWSIFYVLTGNNNLAFLPKSIMPLFGIGILLIFYDLAVREKKNYHFLSIIIMGFSLPIIYSILFITDGAMDVAISFYGFLSFYSFLCLKENYTYKNYFVLLILAISTALTKQAGLYFLFLAAGTLLIKVIKSEKILSLKLLSIVLSVLTIIAFSLSWYLIKEYEIYSGKDHSEIILVTQATFGNSDYIHRILPALSLLSSSVLITILFLTFGLAIIVNLIKKNNLHILFLLIFPLLLAWIFLYSYDLRNICITIPFFTYVSSFGLYPLIKKMFNNNIKQDSLGRLFIRWNYVKVIVVSIMIAGLFVLFNAPIFFNFIYFLYSSLKGSILINYTSEIGYYKYIEYITSSLRYTALLISVLIFLSLTRLKLKHFILFFTFIILFMNFTYCSDKNLSQNVMNEEELEQVRNVYHMLYLYPKNDHIIIKTNFEYYDILSKLNNIIFINEKDISRFLYERDVNYLLIDFTKIDDCYKKYFYKELADRNKKFFKCGDCVLIRM